MQRLHDLEAIRVGPDDADAGPRDDAAMTLPSAAWITRLLVPAATIGLLLPACGDDDADANPEPTAATPTSSTAADDEVDALPFVEDFDDDSNGWGGPYQRFADGEYVWDLPAGQRDTRAPDTLITVEDQLDDLVVTTVFVASGIDAISIQCAYEELEGSSQWYDLELAHDRASIRKRGLGTSPVETLAEDSDVRLGGERTELRAECERTAGAYRLALFVDGTAVVEADDDEPLGRAGAPNLAVVAAPARDGDQPHTVRFDEFTVDTLS